MASNFRWIGKSKSGDQVTLYRFNGEFNTAAHASPEWIRDHPEVVRRGVALDLETTGLNSNTDQIIEIGMRPFLFDRQTGEILRVEPGYSALQDPRQPLSPVICQLTGLSDETLQGKTINWNNVGELLSAAHLVIAHNAVFDRPFLDRKCPESRKKIWACSAQQIHWRKNGLHTSKLELLSIYHGFFVDSHRALADADALLHLISMSAPGKKSPYLRELILNAREPRMRITCEQSPYESKDALRAKGYRWDRQKRVWFRLIEKKQLADEVAWLEALVYRGTFLGSCQEVALSDHFKSHDFKPDNF